MKMEQRTATTTAESNAYDMLLRPAARGDMHVLCVRGVMWPVGAVWSAADDRLPESPRRDERGHRSTMEKVDLCSIGQGSRPIADIAGLALLVLQHLTFRKMHHIYCMPMLAM